MSEARLAELSVWSDVEANSGTRESVFRDPIQLTDRVHIRDDGHVSPQDRIALTVSTDEAAYDDIQAGKVVRVELSDGEATEWRVWKHRTKRGQDGGTEAFIECRSIAWDLFVRTPVIERVEANRADVDFTSGGLTPTEWIDDVILTTDGWPSWLVRGTVDATDELGISVDGWHAGKLLNLIAQVTGHEWTLTRNGSANYQMEVLAERGSVSHTPLVALKKNLKELSQETTAEKLATVVFPRGGGSRGSRSTMADAKWNVDSVSSGVITLSDPAGGDGPVGFDDQLNGLYLEKTNGSLEEVTDSDASADTITVADASNVSANDLISIRRNSSGDELVTLSHPSNETTYGSYEKVLDRKDIPPVQNILSDVSAAFLDEDSNTDGLADGWNLVTGSSGGTATATIDTGADNHRHGTASQKVVASEGEGVVTDAISVSPTSSRPLFHCEVFAKADSGTYQVQLVDATNDDRAYPRSTSQSARNTRLGIFDPHPVAPGVNFDDLSTTSMKVRIVARGGSCTFFVDAAQLVQQHSPTGTFHKARAANRLWQAANDELSSKSSPEDRYEVGAFDFYRKDVDRWPDDQVEAGNTIRLKDAGLSVDAELRVVEVERDLLKPAKSKYRVDRRPKSVAERIAQRDIPELFDEQPPTSGADQTAGTSPDKLNSGAGTVAGSAAPGRYVVASVSDASFVSGSFSPSVGDMRVSAFQASTTMEIQSLEIKDNGGGAGIVRTVIYSDDGFYPDTLLHESGDLNLDGTPNQITVAGPIIEVEKGQTYWVGVQCTANSSGTASVAGIGGDIFPSLGFSVTFGNQGFASLESTGNGSTVPNVFPASATAVPSIVWVAMEVPS